MNLRPWVYQDILRRHGSMNRRIACRLPDTHTDELGSNRAGRDDPPPQHERLVGRHGRSNVSAKMRLG